MASNGLIRVHPSTQRLESPAPAEKGVLRRLASPELQFRGVFDNSVNRNLDQLTMKAFKSSSVPFAPKARQEELDTRLAIDECYHVIGSRALRPYSEADALVISKPPTAKRTTNNHGEVTVLAPSPVQAAAL